MVKKLKFRKKDHSYHVDDVPLTSVTKFVKAQFPEFQKNKVARMVAKWRRKKGEEVTAWDVKREWKAVADAGTLIHEEIEIFIEDFEKAETLLPVFHSKSLAGIDFLLDHFPDAEKKSEWKVFSEELGLAGTIDLFVTDRNGKHWLVDWKTNKKIREQALGKGAERKGNTPVTAKLKNCNFVHYSLQLNTYKLILEKEYDIKIEGMKLVHLKNDEYVVYEIENMQDKVKEMIKWKNENQK